MTLDPKDNPRLGWLFEEEPEGDQFGGDGTAMVWFIVLGLVGLGGIVWAVLS